VWRGLQPAASRLVSTPVLLCPRNSVSRHECRDGSLERLRHMLRSAVETGHGEKSNLEAQVCSQLNRADAAAIADHAEGRRSGHVRAGIAEGRRVGRVGELAANLHPKPFGKLERLQQREVAGALLRAAQPVQAVAQPGCIS